MDRTLGLGPLFIFAAMFARMYLSTNQPPTGPVVQKVSNAAWDRYGGTWTTDGGFGEFNRLKIVLRADGKAYENSSFLGKDIFGREKFHSGTWKVEGDAAIIEINYPDRQVERRKHKLKVEGEGVGHLYEDYENAPKPREETVGNFRLVLDLSKHGAKRISK